MGARGPLPTSASRRSPSRFAAALPAVPIEPPATPEALGAPGLEVWRSTWAESPWLCAADASAVETLCRLEDELVVYRQAFAEHGALLREPIVTPKGDVVGERLVPNPAEGMLRRAERSARDLRAALALSPQAKARLGVTVVRLRREESVLERLAAERSPAGRKKAAAAKRASK